VKALHVIVSGRVQGVWFRASTQQQATDMGVEGWVRNLADGSVEIFMQGGDSSVDRLLSWCYQGPEGANVISVDYEIAEADPSIKGFRIRY